MLSSELKSLVEARGWRLGLRDLLERHFGPDPDVLAAYEGGSAAFHRADDLSDLDMQFVVPDERLEAVVERLESLLDEHAAVSKKLVIPQPAWHGMWQTFYQFSAAPESFMLDICIAKQSDGLTLIEVERHGDAQILFDPEGLIPQKNLDWEEHYKKMRGSLKAISERLPMFHPLVEKEISRGKLSDALWFYNRMLIPDMISLLRMKHCPERYDYGGRYLSDDLPADAHVWITGLMAPADLADLRSKYEALVSRALALIEELSQAEWAREP